MFCLKDVKYKDMLEIPKLSIPEKKITSFIGESGSGKTTLLRLLNKMISCNKGQIFYNGISLEDIDSITHRREVVMSPQNPVVFPGSVKDNLLIGLKFSEKPEAKEDTLNKILKIVCLNKDLSKNAKDLSGGEKQRMCLGRVLLMKPKVLLLDEPTSALDEETENLLMTNIKGYAKQEDITIIMVTHSKNIAKKFSDFIFELKDGRVIKKGRLEVE